MSYSNATTATYRFPATTVSSAAVVGRIIGPAGKRGRLRGAGHVVTTGITTTAGTLDIGSATDDDAYGTLALPIASANAVGNTLTRGSVDEIPADEVVVLTAGGEPAAGAADLIVFIDWY